jgi:hypothetical protein
VATAASLTRDDRVLLSLTSVVPADYLGSSPRRPELTCRMIGSIFCLGGAGLGVLVDPRWTTVKLMLQVQAQMVPQILIAAANTTEMALRRPVRE